MLLSIDDLENSLEFYSYSSHPGLARYHNKEITLIRCKVGDFVQQKWPYVQQPHRPPENKNILLGDIPQWVTNIVREVERG